MYIKSLFLGILILGTVITGSILPCSLEAQTSKGFSTECEAIQGAYTYERVLIDGIWWIIVYGKDGSIIEKYIDPIQD